MKAIRIALQLVIGFAGLVALAVLTLGPKKDPVAIIMLIGAVAALFALTFMLKDETQRRLDPQRGMDARPLAIFLLLLGAFGLFNGFTYLTGTQALPDGSRNCRLVCTAIVFAAQTYGEAAGRWTASAIWLGVGLLLCSMGYVLLRYHRPR